MGDTLKKIWNRVDDYVLVAPFALMVGATVLAGWVNPENRQQQQIQSSLAPAAVYINPKLYSDRITSQNEDVNGDGTYDSVLYFNNPLTGTLERQLIEKCGENICFRPFRVEQGEIVYLEERCRKE